MPAPGAIRAGRAFVEVFAEVKPLIRGLKRASAKLKAFGQSVSNIGLKMAGLGTAVLAPMTAATKAFSSWGDQVAKMAKRTGLSVETLSELKFVASQTGTEFESLEMAFRRMQRSIYDAGRGLSTATDALADLGLKFEDLDGLAPEAQFKLLADRISQLTDPTKKAAIAMTLFGRTGTNLLPMFARGAAGIEALQKEARRLGLTMSSEDAKAAEDFTDALDALWKVVKMGVFHVGAALAPTLKQLAETAAEAAVKINAWIQANREVIVMAAKVAAGAIAAGAGLMAFGKAVSVAGLAVGILGKVLTLLLSPIGLITAAVAGLGAYLLYTTGAGAKAVGWLGQRFQELKDDARRSFRGIVDALKAGDIGLAAKIAWLTLKLWWQKGIGWLKGLWYDFKRWFLRVAANAWGGFLTVFEYVVHGIEIAWIETVAFLRKTWTKFSTGLVKGWLWTTTAVKKLWNKLKGLFVKGFDAEAANRELDRAYQTRLQQIEDEQNARLKAAEERRRRERDLEKRTHDARIRRIVEENDARLRAIDEEHDRAVQATKDELEQTRSELNKLLTEADRKRRSKEKTKAGGPGGLKPPPNLPEITSNIQDAAANMAAVADVIRGQFGGHRIGALVAMAPASTAAERTAAATEQTARNTAKLVKQGKRSTEAKFV